MAGADAPRRGLPRDFGWLWAGQAVSEWGTQLTLLALPTLAITMLSASTFQVGLLATLENLATPLIGLFVGVFIDRVRRRRVLIVADVARMAILAGVVGLYAAGSLRMGHLYIAATLIGVFTVFFTVAYHAYLPFLVGRDQLIPANTRLEVSSSAALIGGPGSAGLLIGAIGSGATMAIDAASFGLSALATVGIRRREPRGQVRDGSWRGVPRDIHDGLRFVWATPVLRALMFANAVGNLGFSMVLGVLPVFAYRSLGLSPMSFGAILTAASTGFLISAFVANRAVRRFGAGWSLVVSNALFCVGLLATPLAQVGNGAGILLAAQFLVNVSLPWYNIVSHSLQQARTPDAVLGRVYATMRTVVWGATPVGLFAGGVAGQSFGVSWALVLGAAAAAASTLALLSRPLRTVREIEPSRPVSPASPAAPVPPAPAAPGAGGANPPSSRRSS